MRLHVRIVEAENLPKMDVFGTVDPYCQLQLTSTRKVERTKTIRQNKHPVWNEEFHFTVQDLSTDTLYLLLKDYDKVSNDDPISRAQIPLSTLPMSKVEDKWIDMIPLKRVKKGGKLRIVIHLGKMNEKPFHPEQTFDMNIVGQQQIPMQQIPSGMLQSGQQIPMQQYPSGAMMQMPAQQIPSGMMTQGTMQQIPMQQYPSGSMQQIPSGMMTQGTMQQMPMQQYPSGSMQQIPSGMMTQGTMQQMPMQQYPSGSMQQMQMPSNMMMQPQMQQIPSGMMMQQMPTQHYPSGPVMGPAMQQMPMQQYPSGPMFQQGMQMQPSNIYHHQ